LKKEHYKVMGKPGLHCKRASITFELYKQPVNRRTTSGNLYQFTNSKLGLLNEDNQENLCSSSSTDRLQADLSYITVFKCSTNWSIWFQSGFSYLPLSDQLSCDQWGFSKQKVTSQIRWNLVCEKHVAVKLNMWQWR